MQPHKLLRNNEALTKAHELVNVQTAHFVANEKNSKGAKNQTPATAA